MFPTPEREKLKRKCESIIREGRISHDHMRHALQGSDILDKYSLVKAQIFLTNTVLVKSELKYERDVVELKF